MLPITTEMKMSSREIAELTGKRHDNVMADIRKMLTELYGEGGLLKFQDTYQNEQNGQTYSAFMLDREHTECLLTGYSAELRMRVIKRWHQLEQEKALGFNPNDQIAVLEHFLLEKKKAQALQIENDSLKNLFVDGMTPAQFAKSLNGVNCQKINSHLANERKWLFNSGKSLAEYDWRVAAYARDNYLTEKPIKISRLGKDEKMKYQPILLKKGAAKIYSMYIAGELPMKANWNGLHTHDKSVRIAG